jgi:hypothetical protein
MGMKRLLPLLLPLLFGACTEKVDLTVSAGSWDNADNQWVVCGVDTIRATCYPFGNVTFLEAMVDGAVVGVDTFPAYNSSFVWDVSGLPEGSIHWLQARATSGSREYFSPEVSAKVGFSTRLVADGLYKALEVYRPDGTLEASFKPEPDAYPLCPRLRPGCHSVVFLADHKLYDVPLPSGQSTLLAEVPNGIYSCDASPVSDLVAFEGYPTANAHLFTVDGSGNKVQLTHDSDYVVIDSSRFTCIANSNPVFSLDGTRLAYYRKSKCLVPGDPHENETREDVFVMNSNGTNPVNLTEGIGDAYFSGFTWTFDGKWVLFRAGTGPEPDGVFAANLSGRVLGGLPIGAVAMAASPGDSSLVYVSIDKYRRLYSMALAWTNDTLYVARAGILVGGEDAASRSYVDWVKYRREWKKRVTSSSVSRQCFDRAGL